jgi:hypothetical protein
MVILQIEHAVPNFDAWKKAFDSDPVNRLQADIDCIIAPHVEDITFCMLPGFEFERSESDPLTSISANSQRQLTQLDYAPLEWK